MKTHLHPALVRVRVAGRRLGGRAPLLAAVVATWDLTIGQPENLALGWRNGHFALYVNSVFALACPMDQLETLIHHNVRHVLYRHPWLDPKQYPDQLALEVAMDVTANEHLPGRLPGKPILLDDYPDLPENEDAVVRYRRLAGTLRPEGASAPVPQSTCRGPSERESTAALEGTDAKTPSANEGAEKNSQAEDQEKGQQDRVGVADCGDHGEAASVSSDRNDVGNGDRSDGHDDDEPGGRDNYQIDSDGSGHCQDAGSGGADGAGDGDGNVEGDGRGDSDVADHCGASMAGQVAGGSSGPVTGGDCDSRQTDADGKAAYESACDTSTIHDSGSGKGTSPSPGQDAGAADHARWPEIRDSSFAADQAVTAAIATIFRQGAALGDDEYQLVDCFLGCKSRGLEIGVGLERLQPKSRSVQVSWQRKLRHFVGEALDRQPSLRRPSRRLPHLIGVVPGICRRPGRPRILAIIDTSGSMSTDMLEDIASELRHLARERIVTIVECDQEIHRVYRFRKCLDQVHGRGGTDFYPPLERAFLARTHTDLAVFFTDGEGPAPENPPLIPVIWALTTVGPPPATWGKVIRMDPNAGLEG